jgi:putative ATP-grasp target RiPP
LISQGVVRESLFPLTDQLPLGRLVSGGDPVPLRSGGVYGSDGVTTGDPEPFPALFPKAPDGDAPGRPLRRSHVEAADGAEPVTKPFGLRFATVPAETASTVRLDLRRIRYDEAGQIALAWDEAGWIPLIEHSMGLTLRTTGQIPREDEIHDKS